MLNISIRMAAIKDGGIKMSLQGKKVLVVGTGKSGIAATELLCANGIDTVLFDGNKELDSKTLDKFIEKCGSPRPCLIKHIFRLEAILFVTC